MNEETLARLREQADRGFPDAWIPEQEGDELVGVIAAVKPAVHTAYGPVPVVEIVELGTKAPWSLWLTHTVLRREFVRQRPALGETVLVRYLGKVQPEAGGAAYESYRLVVDRVDENTDVDWNAIAARSGDEPGETTTPAPPANRTDEPPPHEDDEIPF